MTQDASEGIEIVRGFTYFNLHKRLFSVRDNHTGRVVAHVPWVYIQEPVFRVGAAGRARVRREQRKNVHAGVAGSSLLFDPEPEFPVRGWSRVQYDPYNGPASFTFCTGFYSGMAISHAEEAVLRVRPGNSPQVYVKMGKTGKNDE